VVLRGSWGPRGGEGAVLTVLRALLRSKAADSNRPLRSRSSSSSGSSNRPVTSIFSKPAWHTNRTCISAKQPTCDTTLSWGNVDAKLCQLHGSMMLWLPQLLISVLSSFKAFLWKGEEGRFQAGDHRGASNTMYLANGQSGMSLPHILEYFCLYNLRASALQAMEE